MQLFIIRHAEPDYRTDTLTVAGLLEAEALATRMARQLQPDFLYSSPLGRARATMQPTEKALSKSGVILDWAKELRFESRNGPWGDHHAPFDIPGHWIRSAPDLPSHNTWHRHPPFDDPHIRNEFERVCSASDSFLADHGYERERGRYASVAPNRTKLAIFCHNALGLAWLAHLLEIPLTLMWSGFWLAPSSVTTILFDERDPAWAVPRCIGLGDVSHLHSSGLQRSNMGLKANYE
jgi:broad specificity phosphatase PhoE